MRRLIIKVIILATVVYSAVIGINYFIDPANIYHEGTVNKMVGYLNDNQIVQVPANFDEGVLQEKRISSMNWQPETVVIGSSHVMYIPFDYEHLYNAGMSGSYLGDDYAIIGLLKYYDKMPRRIVIGVDPWSFMSSATDGRHTSLKQYAIYLKNNISTSTNSGELANDSGAIDRRLKELMSFSYFQASIDSLRKNGFKKSDAAVEPIADITEDNAQKMLVDGRRVPAAKDYHSSHDIDQEIDRAIKGGSIYQVEQGFSDIPKEQLSQFEALLQYLQNIGVEVHIYLPAWHPLVYQYFCENEAFVGVSKVEGAMRQLGHKYNMPVHGGYDPSLCDITEDDFMDWLHLKPEKMKENYDFVLDGGL